MVASTKQEREYKLLASLYKAEQELRNRRLYVEADAVNVAWRTLSRVCEEEAQESEE